MATGGWQEFIGLLWWEAILVLAVGLIPSAFILFFFFARVKGGGSRIAWIGFWIALAGFGWLVYKCQLFATGFVYPWVIFFLLIVFGGGFPATGSGEARFSMRKGFFKK
jgi:hypothetical protein